jgi:SsrA-binding protein
MTVLATNRKASHEYHILEKIEAGISLCGTEVKSCRAKSVSLQEAYCKVIKGELWLLQCNISPYTQGNRWNHEPTRQRRLLVHRKEIRHLKQAVEMRGLTIVPLNMHMSSGHVKLDIAVCKGKNAADKRETMRRKDDEREASRAMRQRD